MQKLTPPAVGETWYVKLPKSVQCATVTVDELTERTVVLSLVKDANVSYAGSLGRYVRREIKFVERVAGDQ